MPRHAACGILIPQPGIQPTPPAVEAQESSPLDPLGTSKAPALTLQPMPLTEHVCQDRIKELFFKKKKKKETKIFKFKVIKQAQKCLVFP